MNCITYRPELGKEWEDIEIVFELGACYRDDYLPDPEWAYECHKWYRICFIRYKKTHPQEVLGRLQKMRYIHGDVLKQGRQVPIPTARLYNGDMLVNWEITENFNIKEVKND